MIIQYYGVEDNFCEWDYIQGIIKELNFDNSTQLHVVCMSPERDHRDEVVLDNSKRNVIIGISDEYLNDNVPQEWKDNATTFKSYLLPEQEGGSVFSFPLGYNKTHKKLVNRPIKDRPIDVFVTGSGFSKSSKNYNFKIAAEFDNGLDSDAYSKKLHNSKIVVCPAGTVSKETFRHYEAMRSGAIVVSPKLPETKIYKDAAICQVDDWENNAGNAIMDLLSDLEMLQLVQERQQQTYNNRFTAKAVAKYINELLPTPK
ncbi:hypothetical protein N9Z65_00350 [bacterium]|nr:hypothetical protein [bacterium]